MMNAPTSPLPSLASAALRCNALPAAERWATDRAQWSDNPAGPLAHAWAGRDASLELGYGCVDWFIYVEDATVEAAPALPLG